MFIAILGRQPELSLAELEAMFGNKRVARVGADLATIDTPQFDINQLGGTLKAGKIIQQLPGGKTDHASLLAASHFITAHYGTAWRKVDHKITLGLSAYGLGINPRDVQKTGLILKSSLKKSGVSLRLIPNTEPALSTAVSHNNKLGLSDAKIELIIAKTSNHIIIAESTGAQNITAYARRDRDRPRRDAFVGMLPPKLAQMMVNLALQSAAPGAYVLDPFCGTGTVLQESLLKGHFVLGSDISEKMVSYTIENLGWIQKTNPQAKGTILTIWNADAMTSSWNMAHALDAVVSETYLGQPFSAPPRPEKLKEVVGNCNHIISQFLKNIHPQLEPNTPLCIAVPAWRDEHDHLTHLPLINQLEKFGYKLKRPPLIYARPGQIVAREILVLDTTA